MNQSRSAEPQAPRAATSWLRPTTLRAQTDAPVATERQYPATEGRLRFAAEELLYLFQQADARRAQHQQQQQQQRRQPPSPI